MKFLNGYQHTKVSSGSDSLLLCTLDVLNVLYRHVCSMCNSDFDGSVCVHMCMYVCCNPNVPYGVLRRFYIVCCDFN